MEVAFVAGSSRSILAAEVATASAEAVKSGADVRHHQQNSSDAMLLFLKGFFLYERYRVHGQNVSTGTNYKTGSNM